MSSRIQRVVLCEGYHDRAFWDGALRAKGCTDPGTPKPDKSVRSPVVDPWGKQVKGGGQYAYRTPSDCFVRVIPCMGRERVLRRAIEQLHLHHRGELELLVLNVDSDAVAGESGPGPRLSASNVLDRVRREVDGTADRGRFNDIEIPDKRSKLALVEWSCSDAETPGVPAKNTLERLVCAAVVAAYPNRGPPVTRWLNDRGEDAPPAGPKEFAWSHMAGWYGEGGCEAFYKLIWSEDQVAWALRERLESGNGWRILEALAA